ncbi:Uncharacterised protein [Acinetobacter baumannii]|nr:Uncharacterised protein [Acinetobacter baumannii]
MLEQILGGELDTRLASSAHHLQGDDRVSAQLEEVVGQPDPLQLQYLRPDRRQLLLQIRLRCGVDLLAVAGFRRRQRLAVQLAVGQQRQRRQEHPLGRHHVFRQARLERRLQRFTQGSALLALQCPDILRHHVAQQLLAARTVGGQHHRFAHALLLQQARLDLAQFDTETPDLHLVVQATEIVDLPVSAQPRQVAGTVDPLAVAVRVRNEALRGQPGSSQVATRQAGTGDQQFASATHRTDPTRRIEDARAHPRDRCTNGNFPPHLLYRRREAAGIDGRFGRPVEVDQLAVPAAPQLFQQRAAQRFATAAEQPQRVQLVVAGERQQRLQQRRWHLQHIDPLCLDQPPQAL